MSNVDSKANVPAPISKKDMDKQWNIIFGNKYTGKNIVTASASYWECIGYKQPLTVPNDKKAIDFLVDMYETDPNRALTQGIN